MIDIEKIASAISGGSPITSVTLDALITIAGHETETSVNVSYVFVPGNPARSDEPPQDDAIEIWAVRLGQLDIKDFLGKDALRCIADEILAGGGRPYR